MTSKIGHHIMQGYNGALGRPPVVKLVDVSPEYVRQVRNEVGPDCLIVVRWYEAEQGWYDAAEQARNWYQKYKAEMLAMTNNATDQRVVFEGLNEVPDSEAYELIEFELVRLSWLHVTGLHGCVGNFSVGTPDLPEWDIYQSVLDAMDDGDVLGLHEYWTDYKDMHNPWHVCRFSMVPALDNVPITITEAGRDVVEGIGKQGWKATTDEDGFMADLRRYDVLLAAYPNVIGAVPFTAGRIDPGWRPFDCNAIIPRVVAEMEPYEAYIPIINPAPQPDFTTVRPPMANLHKAWYAADSYFGPYNNHPNYCEDWNLETGGNSDLGEPLVAPFDGLVTGALNYGGGWGNIVSITTAMDGDLVTWRGKHLRDIAVKRGQYVEMGQRIGSIGNAGGRYAAHLHEEIVIGEIPTPTVHGGPEWDFVQPSQWYIEHGVNAALMNRLRKLDGR